MKDPAYLVLASLNILLGRFESEHILRATKIPGVSTEMKLVLFSLAKQRKLTE